MDKFDYILTKMARIYMIQFDLRVFKVEYKRLYQTFRAVMEEYEKMGKN